MEAGAFIGGVLVVLFFGFLANKLGYLSVHKKADKPVSSGGTSGGSGSPRENIRTK